MRQETIETDEKLDLVSDRVGLRHDLSNPRTHQETRQETRQEVDLAHLSTWIFTNIRDILIDE